MFILKKNFYKIKNALSVNQLLLCHCGYGCGKTKIAYELAKEFENSLLINLQFTEVDFMGIAVSLKKKISTPQENLNYFIDYLETVNQKTIIFDHIETCPAESFCTLLNLIKSSSFFESTNVVGFYNDLKLKQSLEKEHYNCIFCEFLDYEILPEIEDISDYCSYIEYKTKKCPALDLVKQLLEDAQYNLNAVIKEINFDLRVGNYDCKDFDSARIHLLTENIKNRLSVFKDKDKLLINQTAAVGTEFDSDFVEACFEIVEVDAILLNIMRYDKQLYKVIKKHTYSFFNRETRECIYNLLTSEQKIDLNSKIAEFCLNKANSFTNIIEIINYLNLAYLHYKETKKQKDIYWTGCKLLKLYECICDLPHIAELCLELLDFADVDERCFLQLFYSKVLYILDRYSESNSVLDQIEQSNSSLKCAGTYRYIELEKIQNCYLNSAEPEAYSSALKLKDSIGNTKDSVFLTRLYSILTSIYDNRGEYANSVKCEKRAYFFAAKCRSERYLNLLYLKSQIHYSSDSVLKKLSKAKEYFSKTADYDLLAQANHNYGSELMFRADFGTAEQPLQKAYEYYKKKGSPWSIYPLNNLAILDVMRGDYRAAMKKLQKPFPCRTEMFTIISVLCNKLACYLKMGEIGCAEDVFQIICLRMKGIESASNSFYLGIYVDLMRGLISFYNGEIEKSEQILLNIRIPESYPFLQEFVRGFTTRLHHVDIEYQFPYIKKYVEEKIYLCDFLFIE